MAACKENPAALAGTVGGSGKFQKLAYASPHRRRNFNPATADTSATGAKKDVNPEASGLSDMRYEYHRRPHKVGRLGSFGRGAIPPHNLSAEQPMNAMIRKTISATSVVPMIAAAALIWPGASSAAGAKALEGTWDIAVTLRNCESGAEIRSFPRMITFAKGGTLSEYAAAGTEAAPAARAPGHGVWEYLGDSAFTYSLKFMLLTPQGGPNGFISELRELEVSKSGNSFAADGVAVITFASGGQSPQLCATEAGTRLF